MNSMLRKLFSRLTKAPPPGAPLFDRAVAEARQRQWYLDGQVPDSVDGRFAVLATVVALVVVRLEEGGQQARRNCSALVERFVDAMDGEHRQMGVSDPAIGKTVRRLVGALANRVDLWREACSAPAGWDEAVSRSLYRGNPPSADALHWSSETLRGLSARLSQTADEALIEGRIS